MSRGPYRRSPAQMVPGSGGRMGMAGNRPPSTSAAISMHQLQQQGPPTKRT
nr:unnamed protein product [Callosobruchus chinensis]